MIHDSNLTRDSSMLYRRSPRVARGRGESVPFGDGRRRGTPRAGPGQEDRVGRPQRVGPLSRPQLGQSSGAGTNCIKIGLPGKTDSQ